MMQDGRSFADFTFARFKKNNTPRAEGHHTGRDISHTHRRGATLLTLLTFFSLQTLRMQQKITTAPTARPATKPMTSADMVSHRKSKKRLHKTRELAQQRAAFAPSLVWMEIDIRAPKLRRLSNELSKPPVTKSCTPDTALVGN